MTAAIVLALVGFLGTVGCKVRDRDPAEAASGAPATRVVSFSPALTEVVVELGAADRLVGVSTFESHPDLDPELPRVGGMIDPNLELLVALEPDLILTTPSVAQVADFAAESLPEARVVSREIDSLQALDAAWGDVGEALGIDEGIISAARSRVRDALGPEAPAAGPRVLLVVGREAGGLGGLVAAGPGTFLDQVLRRAGGQNALEPGAGPYPQLGIEGIVALAPDLVVELHGTETAPAGAAAVWRDALPELPAAEHVVVLAGSHLLLPGPRVVETLAALRGALAAASAQP